MKKLKLLDILIICTFITTALTWLFVDMLKLINIPFLTFYGITHWLPELLFVFLVGYSLVGNNKISPVELDIIIVVLFLYPLIYYGFTGHSIPEYIFGFGTACIFSGIFLLGVWYGKKTKPKNHIFTT